MGPAVWYHDAMDDLMDDSMCYYAAFMPGYHGEYTYVHDDQRGATLQAYAVTHRFSAVPTSVPADADGLGIHVTCRSTRGPTRGMLLSMRNAGVVRDGPRTAEFLFSLEMYIFSSMSVLR